MKGCWHRERFEISRRRDFYRSNTEIRSRAGRVSRRRAVSRSTSSRSNRVSIKSFVMRTKGHRAIRCIGEETGHSRYHSMYPFPRPFSFTVDPHTHIGRTALSSRLCSEFDVAIRGHLLRKSIRGDDYLEGRSRDER